MRKYTDVYRGEDEPKVKDVLWIHHSKYNDLQSGIIAEVYSKGKWVSLNSSDDSDGEGPGSGTTVRGLIVNGTWVESDDGNSYNFIPNAGEPSFDDAVNAFRSGRPVFARYIKYFDGTAVEESIVLFDSCNIDFTDDNSTSISHLLVNNSYLFWSKSSSSQNADEEDDNIK